ncbi:unnamed protein product [Diabrotica balteata]|uniref:Uncharacterized protein n=1 Tax=Diabrotica balteata TaxID=107213 RepID=A0A9N9XB54_DIABA|nr:unnamed protein product [Diabrotica balteata]
MQPISGKKQNFLLDTQEKKYINHSIHSNKENHYPVLNRADFLREIDEKQQHIYKIIYKAYQEIDNYKTHFLQEVPNQQQIKEKENTSLTSNKILKKQTDNKVVRIENLNLPKQLFQPNKNKQNDNLEMTENGKNYSHSINQKSSNHSFDAVISTIEINKQVVEKFDSILSDIRKSRETNKISKTFNWTDDIEDIEREQENYKTILGFKEFMEEILSYLVYMYHDLIGEYENCLNEFKKGSNSDNLREKYKQCTKTSERKFLQKLKMTSDIIKQTFLAVTEKLVVDNVESILKTNQTLEEHDNVLQIINELNDACEYIRKSKKREMMFGEAQTETDYDETISDDISDINKLQHSENNSMFNDKYVAETKNKVKHEDKIINAIFVEESDVRLNIDEITKSNQLQDRKGEDEYFNVHLTSKEELLENIKQETDLMLQNKSTSKESINGDSTTIFTSTEKNNEVMEETSYISALPATEAELSSITSEGESLKNAFSNMTIDRQPKTLQLETSNQQDLTKLKPQQGNLNTEHNSLKPNIESTNLNENTNNLKCNQEETEENMNCKVKLSKDEIVQQLNLIYESIKTDSQYIRDQGNERSLQPIPVESQIKLEKSKLIIFEQLKFLYDNLCVIYHPLYKQITDGTDKENSLRNQLFNEANNRKYVIESEQFRNKNLESQTNQQKIYRKDDMNMIIINPTYKVDNVNGVMKAQAVYQMLQQEYQDLKTKNNTTTKTVNVNKVPKDNEKKCPDKNDSEISKNATVEKDKNTNIKYDVNAVKTSSNWNNTKKQIENELKSKLNQLKSNYQNQLHEIKIQWEKRVNYLYNHNYKIEQEIINIDKKIEQLPSTDRNHLAELKTSYQEMKEEYKAYISKKQMEIQQEKTNFEEGQKQIEEKIKLLEHKIDKLIQEFQQKRVQNNVPNVPLEENYIKDEKLQELCDHDENNSQYIMVNEEHSKENGKNVTNEEPQKQVNYNMLKNNVPNVPQEENNIKDEKLPKLNNHGENNTQHIMVNKENSKENSKHATNRELQKQVNYNMPKYLKTSNNVENRDSNKSRNKPLMKSNDTKVTGLEIKYDKNNFNRTYKISKTFDGETKLKENTNQNDKKYLKEITKTPVKTHKTVDKQSKPSRLPEIKKSIKPIGKDVDDKDLGTKLLSASKTKRAVTPSILKQRKNISETKHDLDNKELEKGKKLNSYIAKEKSPILGSIKQQIMKPKSYVPTKKLQNNIRKKNCHEITQNEDSAILEKGIHIENTPVDDKTTTNDEDDTKKDMLIEMIRNQLQHLQDTLQMVESQNSIKIHINNTESSKYFENMEKEIAIVGKNLELEQAKVDGDNKNTKNGIVKEFSMVSVSSGHVEEIDTTKAGRYLHRNLDQLLLEFRTRETEKNIRDKSSKKHYLIDDVSANNIKNEDYLRYNDIPPYMEDSIAPRDMIKKRNNFNDLVFDLQEDELLEKNFMTPTNSFSLNSPEYQLGHNVNDIFIGGGQFIPRMPKMRQYVFGVDTIDPIGLQKDGKVTNKHYQLFSMFETAPLDKLSQYYSDHSLYNNLKKSNGSVECVDKIIQNAEQQLQRLDEKYKIVISDKHQDNVPKKIDSSSKYLKIEDTNDILKSAEKQLQRLQKYQSFDGNIPHKNKLNLYIRDENINILSLENLTDRQHLEEKGSLEIEHIFHYGGKPQESLKGNEKSYKEGKFGNIEIVKSKTEIFSSWPERQTKRNKSKVKDWGDVSNSRQSNLKRVSLPNQNLWEGKNSFDAILNLGLDNYTLSDKLNSSLNSDNTKKNDPTKRKLYNIRK